jgi:hypothetical protein
MEGHATLTPATLFSCMSQDKDHRPTLMEQACWHRGVCMHRAPRDGNAPCTPDATYAPCTRSACALKGYLPLSLPLDAWVPS